MAYKLLKDINTPEASITVGTVGTKLPYSENFTFVNGNQCIQFHIDYMAEHPDWFEYTGEKRWTDEDLIAFAKQCAKDEPLNPEEIRTELVEFIKTRTT